MNKTLIIIAVVFLTSACASQQFAELARNLASSADPNLQAVGMLAQGNREITEPEEIAVGNEIAGGLLNATALVKDPELQTYINDIGMWLALNSERPDLPWRFGVTDTLDYNAFSLPGGVILISQGVLARCKNESELANILAHEIAHVLKKHHIKAIQQESKSNAYKGMGKLASEQLKTNAQLRSIASQAIHVGADLYSRGLDKADEFEADTMAVVIAARSGFNPLGLITVLEDLHHADGSSSRFSLLFKTHPAPAERIEKIKSAMGNELTTFATINRSSQRFSMVKELTR